MQDATCILYQKGWPVYVFKVFLNLIQAVWCIFLGNLRIWRLLWPSKNLFVSKIVCLYYVTVDKTVPYLFSCNYPHPFCSCINECAYQHILKVVVEYVMLCIKKKNGDMAGIILIYVHSLENLFIFYRI